MRLPELVINIVARYPGWYRESRLRQLRSGRVRPRPGSVGVPVWLRPGDQLVQDRGQAVQLDQVSRSQFVQDSLAPVGQPDPDEPAVAGVGGSLHKAGQLRAVDQLDRAVMPQQEVAREVSDGRRRAAGMALDRDQQLMLDMGQPGLSGLVLAPSFEPAQAAAERQQVLEILAGLLGHALFLRSRPGRRLTRPIGSAS